MPKRTLMGQNTGIFCVALILTFFLGCLLTWFLTRENPVAEMKMYRIKESLRISGEDGGCYFLPVGTVLYFQTGFDEGHALYWTPFYHKGNIKAEEIKLEPKHNGRLVIPLWLDNPDEDRTRACGQTKISRRNARP